MSEDDMTTKALVLRDAIKGAMEALTVALVASEELLDACAPATTPEDLRAAPATDEQRRHVAALRKLLKQPPIDGVALTQGQAAHEVAYWTAEAERRAPTAEQRRHLDELAAALALDGIAVQIPARLSLAAYVRELRRLKKVSAERRPAGRPR